MSQLTGVSSLMNLEILASGEHLAARGKGTGEGFFAGMNANMVDKFVLGFERSATAWTVAPEARVVGALWPANMFHRDVTDNLVHRVKALVARFLWYRLLWLDPEANQLLFEGRIRVAHVAEERLRRMHVHLRREAHVAVRVCAGLVEATGVMSMVMVLASGRCPVVHRSRVREPHLTIDVARSMVVALETGQKHCILASVAVTITIKV